MSTIGISAEHACALVAVCAAAEKNHSMFTGVCRGNGDDATAEYHENAAVETRALHDYLTGSGHAER